MHWLNQSFTDPNIVKVLHGAQMDVLWLQRDFGVYIVNLFDTYHASNVLDFGKHSLAHLLKHYCDVDADKKYQLADWRLRYVYQAKCGEGNGGVFRHYWIDDFFVRFITKSSSSRND